MHPAYPPNSSLPEAGPLIQPPEPFKALIHRIEAIERRMKETIDSLDSDLRSLQQLTSVIPR